MKIIDTDLIPNTVAHDSITRKAIITNGQLHSNLQTLNYAWLDPGQTSLAHKHDDCEEIFIVTHGDANIIINEVGTKIRKGNVVVINRGEIHLIKNDSKIRLEFYSVRIKL